MATGKTNAAGSSPAKIIKYDNSGSGLAATNVQAAIDEVNENIPSSLPADGGNADTVGGKSPSDFATAGHNHDSDYADINHNHDSAYAAKSHNHTVSQITDFPDSLPADGGNADTVGGKSASDFATAGHNHDSDYADINHNHDSAYAAKSHSHTVSQITDFPDSLPADGGNADTVGGKSASDFATAGHTHTPASIGAAAASHNHDADYADINHNHDSAYAAKSHNHTVSQITDFPDSLPADGGDADTVDGKHASDFATAEHNHDADYADINHNHDSDYAAADHNHDGTYAPTEHNHTVSQITDFPDSLPADGGNADTVDGKHAADFATADHDHDADYAAIQNGLPKVTTEGTDGVAYTATVPGIDALEAGASFILVPNITSTSQATTLNVNGLGAKSLRQQLSSNTATSVAPATSNWLSKGKPIQVIYNGTFWVAQMTRPDCNNLYGTAKIENGGTGATTAEAARTNLGAEASGTAAGLINRSTAVNAADTNYTTLMARGTSLNSAETTPAVNGAIAWTYE